MRYVLCWQLIVSKNKGHYHPHLRKKLCKFIFMSLIVSVSSIYMSTINRCWMSDFKKLNNLVIYISGHCAGNWAIFIYFFLQRDLLYYIPMYYYCPITLKQKLVQERSYKKRSNLTAYQIKKMAIRLFVSTGPVLSGHNCRLPALHSIPSTFFHVLQTCTKQTNNINSIKERHKEVWLRLYNLLDGRDCIKLIGLKRVTQIDRGPHGHQTLSTYSRVTTFSIWRSLKMYVFLPCLYETIFKKTMWIDILSLST